MTNKPHTGLVLSVFLLLGCSAQSQIDRALSTDLGYEKLYGSTAYSVYYDPIARQCVAYAIFNTQNAGGGIGLDTFECDPDELRKRAQARSR